MKKMSYKEKIEAAYMEKFLGVRFIDYDGGEPYEYSLFYPDTDMQEIESFGSELIFYVHPGSHSIFEPQVGDLMQWTLYKGKGRHIEQVHTSMAHDDLIEALKSGDKSVSDIKIIQRDGKAFFTPEREE